MLGKEIKIDRQKKKDRKIDKEKKIDRRKDKIDTYIGDERKKYR